MLLGKHKVAPEKQVFTRKLIVGILFCAIFNTVLFVASPHFINREIVHKRVTYITYSEHSILLCRFLELNRTTVNTNKTITPIQQTVDKKIKNPFLNDNAIRNEMWQLTKVSQKEKVVPALESQTYVELLTTRQQTGRDKFSDTVPKAFAPP
jgi:hypothetical protein